MSRPLAVQRWSPMSCLPNADLTPSGLLEVNTDDGEVEVLTRDNVELRIAVALPTYDYNKDNNNNDDSNSSSKQSTKSKTSGKWIDRDDNLICTLTTHRLVLTCAKKTTTMSKQHDANSHTASMDLCLVNQASSSGGTLSSAKIRLTTLAYGEVYLVFHAGGSTRDAMLSSLQKCLQRQAWLVSVKAAQRKLDQESRSQSKTRVGVDAILAKNKERHSEAKRISEAAFSSDVEGLMAEAKDLVQVIHRYVATLEKKKRDEAAADEKPGSSSTRSQEQSQEERDEEELTNMLRNMGMMTAITKHSAGTVQRYHEQLARQMADFLRQHPTFAPEQHAAATKKKKKHKTTTAVAAVGGAGMMTLTDVYCLYNRARGTNLISPDDMLTVAELLSSLKLGFHKREFPSGVVVLQSDAHHEGKMASRLKDLAASMVLSPDQDEEQDGSDNEKKKTRRVGGIGLTALQASRALQVSAVLALEQLQSAERLGYLCRDETLEGLRFFPNLFKDAGWGEVMEL